MTSNLAIRQKAYEQAYDQTIIRRVPIVLRVDGRSFSKVTRKLPKPYCPVFMDIMSNTMLATVKEIDGAVFAYQQSDEITFVIRNDQTHETEPFFGNRVQKICSVVSSIATLEFNNYLSSLVSKPNIIGKAIFDCRMFAVPDITEAVNNLVWRQYDCMRNSIGGAALAEISHKFGRKTAHKMLHGKNSTERLDILFEKCDIDFYNHYPMKYIMGSAAYKAPKIINKGINQSTRNKWIIDTDLPKFSDDRDFVIDIINSGHDIFRAERDL